MLKYLLKKVIHLIFVMLIVSILVFISIRVIPGDSAEVILRTNGIEPTVESIERFREELGLNQPLLVQYIEWLTGVLRGDFGRSFITGRPVLEEVWYRFPATLELTAGGVVVMLLLSLPVGILAAVFKNTAYDHLGRILALLGASVPSFWLGMMLIYWLAVKQSFFPVMGRGSLQHLILPAFTLGLGMAATYSRLLRASMLEVLKQDYIRVARAKGLQERSIILKHALRNALIPVITAFGVSFGHLLGGTVVVETVFTWPGMGRFVVDAIFSRDYPVIQAYVLVMALVFVTVNFLVDLIYQFLDPRINFERGS
ncbi:ABC transporter permease [Natroniella acetigena]|uniref:nickel ABC transporter permease n=1 Tax=Natroniella acetigena TaxID=52004 RepID=UPI00200B52FF|nr:ABC transporter permease [Natroniella acetigena]